MPKEKLRFTAEDREAIRKQSIGRATDVSIELNGVELNLVPLSVGQAVEVFALLKSFVALRSSADKATGEAVVPQDDFASLISTEGDRVKTIMHDVLYDSAVATSATEGVDVDEELFHYWFDHLPLLSTLKALFPKIIEAQGLNTMLGNSSPPTAQLVPTTA